MDIAGKYNCIRLRDDLSVGREWLKFIVQIGQDKQLHGFTIQGLVAELTGPCQFRAFYCGRSQGHDDHSVP
jgi:hypothetical protein